MYAARRVVSERLAELGHCLRQRVVGDRDVRPQRLEQLVLRDQHGRPRDEVQQEVDDLGRKLNDLLVTKEPERGRIEGKRTKPVHAAHRLHVT